MTYHHGNLKEALLQAATELLVEDGPQKLSLRAAARQAGVSQSAPYRHFSAKGELLAAVGQRGFVDLKELMLKGLEGLENHRDRLRQVGTSYVQFAQDNPQLFRLMFGPLMTSENHNEELSSPCQECFGVLLGVITAGQEAGVFRSGPPEVLSKTAWAMVHGVAHLALDGQLNYEKFGNLEQMLHMLCGHLYDGLKAN